MRSPSCATHGNALWQVGRVVCVLLLVWGCVGCETLRERREKVSNDPRPRSEQLRSGATRDLIVSGVALVVAGASLAVALSQERAGEADVAYVGVVLGGVIAIVSGYHSIALINRANAASHRELEDQIQELREQEEESAAVESLLMTRYGLESGTEAAAAGG